MRNNNGSFASRLSLQIIVVSSLIFIATIVTIFVQGAKVAVTRSQDYCAQVMRSSINRLEYSVKSAEMISNKMAVSTEIFYNAKYSLDTLVWFQSMENNIRHFSFIRGAGIFFLPDDAGRFGLFVSQNPLTGEYIWNYDDEETLRKEGWDYLKMRWYEFAVEHNASGWIPPFIEHYESSGTDEHITAYVVPVRDKNGDLLAVFDVDISLEWLRDELLSMRKYPASNVILIDSAANIICNPLSDTPDQGNLSDNCSVLGIGNGIEDLDWEIREDGMKCVTVRIDGYDLICIMGELSNGWKMLITNTYSDVMDNLKQTCLLIGVIAVLGLVLIFFVSRRIIHKETEPLTGFALAAGKITDGRFDVPIPPVKTGNELYELGEALKYMQKSVTEYICKLKVTTAEKERLAGELEIAKKIQTQMLNTDFPVIDGGGMYALNIPAYQVGGDLYDFFVKEDKIFYIIGDVSGKGVSAALLMAISISAFRAAIRRNHTMEEVISIINSVFCLSNKYSMFITVNAGCINTKTGEAEICNAGNPMVVVSPDGAASFLPDRYHNPACGAMPDFQYKSDRIMIPKGSRLIGFTDGVTEARDAFKAQYGDDRLLEFAKKHSKRDVPSDKTVITELAQSVTTFVGGTEQFDDITMISISV